ncbi:MAG: efflux RND transporter periplasmic adaptor subunit [Terracidiphilus sp.]
MDGFRAVPTGLRLNIVDAHPALKRGANDHCAYGAGDSSHSAFGARDSKKLSQWKKQAWTGRSTQQPAGRPALQLAEKPALLYVVSLLVAVCFAIILSGCKGKDDSSSTSTPQVIHVPDMNLITVEPNDAPKFPVLTAGQVESATELTATGSVFPDVNREIPVISMANGRVVDIKTRLDDNVKKGQLLLKVQSPDITAAFNAYLKASNDEHMAEMAFKRADDLLHHGAISQAQLEAAEDAAKDAKADLTAAEEQLKTLGVDKDHPRSVVNVYAPISGVIVAQNVTNSAAAGVTLSGSATAFTIADLSTVWIICDVYENDIPRIQLGQQARIKLNAFPDRPLNGVISDIGPILDPSLRTAKVRIEVANPGFLRLGMFGTATFTSHAKETHAVVPADAVLHLHDRDWVFQAAGGNHFKRIEVHAGRMLDGNRQEILSGLAPGEQVVGNALLLETAGNQ